MSKYRVERVPAPIEVIKPAITNKLPLGYKYVNHPYANILLLAKKNSGKTNIIYNLLKQCANRSTEVVIFCPTVDLDDSYKIILDYLDSREIPHQQFKNLDTLADLLTSYNPLIQDAESESESDEEQPVSPSNIMAMCHVEKKEEVIKKRPPPRSKFIVPEHIFIFDDLKEKMRNKVLDDLIATNRHYKSKVIISTHNTTDIKPGVRTCLDVMCLFPKIPIDRIYDLVQDVQLATPIDDVIDLYEQATEADHNFLYVDIRREQFSFNFDKKIIKK